SILPPSSTRRRRSRGRESQPASRLFHRDFGGPFADLEDHLAGVGADTGSGREDLAGEVLVMPYVLAAHQDDVVDVAGDGETLRDARQFAHPAFEVAHHRLL